METLVRELPVEIVVLLGSVEVSLSLLAQLRPGDVVILNQRVSEPLLATVASEKKFRVWPGRVGSQQAVRIESSVS
jgi:flagellar motor switch protein FliM